MRIAITTRFLNSFFSGSTPQVACALARALAHNHEVELVYPPGEQGWFIDNLSFKSQIPTIQVWSPSQSYDLVIEVVWSLAPQERVKQRTIHFVHYPPIFGDMESSVYPFNSSKRTYENVAEIWTYDFYSQQDTQYLEFLSGTPVRQVPYLWDADALDAYIQENKVPEWSDGAQSVESSLPKDLPPSMSWCLRIFESNISNSSHCIVPLNIVSEIRKTVEPVRFAVHNSELTAQNEFMKQNILKNLLLPDISGAVFPRIRLPDTRREKTVVLAHQRWRPMKSFLLDSMYLGIPMIHNNVMLKNLGAPYWYELNQIRDAVSAYKRLTADYTAKTGFFSPNVAQVRQKLLRTKFGPNSLATQFNDALKTPIQLSKLYRAPNTSTPKQTEDKVLRIAFAKMWDDFQPEHNFFTYLLKFVGSLNNITVKVDHHNPNVVFWGPLSEGTENAWPNVPKVYFTGENARATPASNTKLNIGYDYDITNNYVRLPLWVLEVNWFGGDLQKMKNPLPVSVAAATTVPDISNNRKFCAFVATNPNNNIRNATFALINNWRPVDSGGRLFCNLPNGPIPAGRGGAGGELAKVEFYKNYKFVLAIENSASEGYCTEKMFHAKVAGAVPIYWGDRFADRDFDKQGYIDICDVKSPQEVIDRISAVMNDEEKWRQMASIPAITGFKKEWCYRTMAWLAQRVFKTFINKDVVIPQEAWGKAESFAASITEQQQQLQQPQQQQQSQQSVPPTQKVLTTATNAKYAESAVNFVRSFRQHDKTTSVYVYIWPDVTEQIQKVLLNQGATELRRFPTEKVLPWPDFWEPQHFAWKLWLHKTLLDELKEGTCMLYIDSGVVFTSPIENLWSHIEQHGILAIDDATQPNRRWCHPDFCRILNTTEAELSGNQLWAGCFGYRKGAYDSIATEAVRIADNHREAIVGSKWTPYSHQCMGHRHDQSILSILTQRYKTPRMPLNDVYSDHSLRAAEQFGAPLYVHRGTFNTFKPFVQGIDECYLINLQRRKDRLDSWKANHKDMKDFTYVLYAVDGRQLKLDQRIVNLFRTNDFKWKKSVMGCALSHMKLWDKLAADPLAKSYLIMEDDVRFNAQWLQQWATMSQQIPADADVIYLGGVLPPNKPALPMVTESVNSFFAKVRKNNLYGGPERRYFHFCNYSYVLTQRGAQKLCALIQERGIFTSGDHMIVNHGDSLLNIYFTTPLLSTCFQEDDPVYQKSEFNNFNRVDNFDSDLWNNTECFSEAEIAAPVAPVAPVVPVVPVASLSDKNAETKSGVDVFNNFLTAIVSKDHDLIEQHTRKIFAHWSTLPFKEFIDNFGWVRIFEQFILTKHESLQKHGKLILSLIVEQPHYVKEALKTVVQELENVNKEQTPSITLWKLPEAAQQEIYVPPIINSNFLEQDWLSELYKKPVVFKKLENLDDLLKSNNPTLLYQTVPHAMEAAQAVFQSLTKAIQASGSKVTLLHLSDEFGKDDISIYDAYSKVIRNYVRPNLPQHVRTIPLGYTNGRHARSLEPSPTWSERPYLWSFAGSMDRPGRADVLEILKRTGDYLCEVKENWSAKAKLDGPAYNEMLRKSKFVPCLGGSSALESYRMYEALEHGAIPFYVPYHGKKDEYELLFSQRPMLCFQSWEQAVLVLPQLAQKEEIMEKQRLASQEWWQQQKQLFAL